MKVAVFSTKAFDRQFLEAANSDKQHDLIFFIRKDVIKRFKL